MKADEILEAAADHLRDRAAARDTPGGERSMGKTVAAFNAVTGSNMSERDGWIFMVLLKAVRACTTPAGRADDYEDLAAYGALAGECAAAPRVGIRVKAVDHYDKWLSEQTLPNWARWVVVNNRVKVGGAEGVLVASETMPKWGPRGWLRPDGKVETVATVPYDIVVVRIHSLREVNR